MLTSQPTYMHISEIPNVTQQNMQMCFKILQVLCIIFFKLNLLPSACNALCLPLGTSLNLWILPPSQSHFLC